MEVALILAATAILLWLNVKATVLVVRDDLSNRSQKSMQLAFVWFLPLLGAIVVLAVHRREERSSGKYPEAPDPGDDYASSGYSHRAVKEALDDDG